MYRVVALGYFAGEIADQLRAECMFNDIKFVYCHSDESLLIAHGNEHDEHIMITDTIQCRKAIHSDNDLMAILVTDLSEDCSLQYAAEIMSELWSFADRTYCFASIPIYAGGKRDKAIEVFKRINTWTDLSILQDNLKQDGVFFIDRDYGTICLLDLVLQHPNKSLVSQHGERPFGVWATGKQVHTALMAMYSNNRKMSRYYNAGTFSFHKNTHRYQTGYGRPTDRNDAEAL